MNFIYYTEFKFKFFSFRSLTLHFISNILTQKNKTTKTKTTTATTTITINFFATQNQFFFKKKLKKITQSENADYQTSPPR